MQQLPSQTQLDVEQHQMTTMNELHFCLTKYESEKKRNKSVYEYTTPYAGIAGGYELSTIDEDTYFDTYGASSFDSEVSSGTISQIQRWSAAINRFFQRTKTLRNIRMFWQQILFTIFIILGKNFIY